MKLHFRSLLLALLLLPVLTVSALAWTPSPELELRILGLDAPPAALEILEDGEVFTAADPSEQAAGDDTYLLYTPFLKDYQVHLVTAAGEDYLSPTLSQKAYHTSAILDWEAQLLTLRSPVAAMLLFFLVFLALSLGVKAALILPFHLRPKWKPILAVCTVTQVLMAQYYARAALESSVTAWFVLSLVISQFVIFVIEALVFWLLLRKDHDLSGESLAFPLAGNILALIVSAIAVFPLWRLMLTMT